jgi:hypothetical protein
MNQVAGIPCQTCLPLGGFVDQRRFAAVQQDVGNGRRSGRSAGRDRDWCAIKGQKAKQSYAIAVKDCAPFGVAGAGPFPCRWPVLNRTCSAHGCDEQDYNDGSTQNDQPIGNLNARYGCFLAKPVHHFPPF